jgi:hypothetical protein
LPAQLVALAHAKSGNIADSHSRDARVIPRSVTNPGDEACGRHVEREVLRLRIVGRDGDAHRLPVVVAAGDHRHLVAVAHFDGNALAGGQPPVDRRRRKRHVERNVAFAGGERLAVRPDLVAHVAVARHAIRAHDHDVDVAPLHEEGARAVGHQRVRNAPLVELPRGQVRALHARARLAHPDFERQAIEMREEDGRCGRAPAAGRKCARVAVGHHAHGAWPPLRDAAQDRDAVLADRAVHDDILPHDGVGLGPCRVGTIGSRKRRDFRAHPLKRPAEVDGGRARGVERRECARKGVVRRVAIERESEAVSADRADERRAADPHLADGECCSIRARDLDAHERVRQRALVDHVDVARAARSDQRAIVRGIVVLHLLQHLEEVVEVVRPDAPVATCTDIGAGFQEPRIGQPHGILRDQHPARRVGERQLAVVADPQRVQVELVGDAFDHGHEVEIAIGHVERNHAVGLHVLEVDLDCFARDEVHGNRVAREGVDREHVEVLRRLALERQARVAERQLDGRVGVLEVAEVALGDLDDPGLMS